MTISLGGATGGAGFANDSQASDFADQIWNIFLGEPTGYLVFPNRTSIIISGGSSDTRPFGDAVLDGIDLDIEGGATTGYTTFVTQIRSHTDAASKT